MLLHSDESPTLLRIQFATWIPSDVAPESGMSFKVPEL